ncbi:helix-turn-helix transcriptional regulator [Staphylococcus haemolyticus]|uniref:helix-turn-helix transcriptional regulator n=1 Tax=Staphylococcus haemolyticus TaxID=1283 RepID=UPI0015D71EC8|nr:helix-turn-helix transcriptional regulator [Staphylococcus haemolyticus]MDT3947672.1 helix-turn-helix transcriptional regulator [Staphylococcus haemolyticus]
MELDKKLKELRNDRDVTQEYLAKKLCVSVQTINKWENGKCLPDAINLLNIAQFYGVSLDNLMENEVPSKLRKKKDKKSSLRWVPIFSYIFRRN